jgi:hypothetical protein
MKMRVKQYKIQQIAEPDEDLLHQWQIELLLEPCWWERFLFAKYLPEKKFLRGSCMHWCWGYDNDAKPAGYLWKVWAYHALRLHKEKETSIAN